LCKGCDDTLSRSRKRESDRKRGARGGGWISAASRVALAATKGAVAEEEGGARMMLMGGWVGAARGVATQPER
jgi:hypothetical protein